MTRDCSDDQVYDELFDEFVGTNNNERGRLRLGINTAMIENERDLGYYPASAEPFCLVWKDLSVLLKKKETKVRWWDSRAALMDVDASSVRKCS